MPSCPLCGASVRGGLEPEHLAETHHFNLEHIIPILKFVKRAEGELVGRQVLRLLRIDRRNGAAGTPTGGVATARPSNPGLEAH